MEFGLKFIDKINKESQLHEEWIKNHSVFLSTALSIGFSIAFSLFTSTRPGEVYSFLKILSGCFVPGLIVFFVNPLKLIKKTKHKKYLKYITNENINLFRTYISLCVSVIAFFIIGSKLMQNEKLLYSSSAAALISGASAMFFTLWLSSKIHSKRLETIGVLQGNTSLARAGTMLKSFLSFIEPNMLEASLRKLNDTHGTKKILLASVIKESLNRSHDNEIKIVIDSYADHSDVLADLLHLSEQVCFTCIKSPYNWFTTLSKSKEVNHYDLSPELTPTKQYNIENLKKIDASYANKFGKKYPEHYIQFLTVDLTVRRRVFLLNNDEWENLVNPDYYDFFQKFMLPCENNKLVETRFVNIDLFENEIEALDRVNKAIINNAKIHNITTQDYDIFEEYAAMIYQEKIGYLKFILGDNVKMYSQFIKFIFSDKIRGHSPSNYHIHTYDEVNQQIISKMPTS